MNKFLCIFILHFLFISSVFWYTQNELKSANTLAGKNIIQYKESEYDYRLNDTITRKEFMKVFANLWSNDVWETCGSDFRDVENDWGCKYITWALKNKQIANNGYFRPSDSITKAESMKLILKARWISRQSDSGDWRIDDMKTAQIVWIIQHEYSDFDSYADRGWIFEVAATEIDTYSYSNSSWWGNNNPYLVP